MAVHERPESSNVMPHPAESVVTAFEAMSQIILALVPAGRLSLISLQGDMIQIVASAGSGAMPVGSAYRSPTLATLPFKRLFEALSVAETSTIAESEELRAPLLQLGFGSGLVGVLNSSNDVTYCVVVDRVGGDSAAEDLKRVAIAAVIQQTAAGIGSAALKLQASVANANLETIVHLGVALGSVLDLGIIAEQTVEYASLLLGLPAAVVLFREEAEREYRVLASEGLPKSMSRLTATPIDVAGLEVSWPVGGVQHSPGSLLAALEKRGLANAFVAPLFTEAGRGAVLLGLDRPQRRCTEEERNAFQLLAIQSATAMRSAGLYAKVIEAARLSDALNAANKVVHSSLDIDRVMQSALDTGVEALECEAAAIEILEGEDWVVRYQHGFSPETVGVRLSEEDASIGALAAQRGSAMAVDFAPAGGKGYTHLVTQHAFKSVLSVPLMVRAEVIGCAQFYSSSPVTRFDATEIDFAEKLGSAVSLGYENARLYESEHRIAETLQQALLTLPDCIPGIEFEAYYRSASESTLVGGDFYDLFELDPQRLGIIIGDIAGKGLAAAVLTSLVRNTIRAYAFEPGKLPAEVLRLTNDVVENATPVEAFATVFYGVLERSSGQLCYASAGHTRAAILRHEAANTVLDSTGPVLGAFAGMQFEESTTSLDQRDILFLYTDGLTEARRDGDLYGEQRLFAGLGLVDRPMTQDLVARVVSDVMEFSNGHLRDDLAILAVSRVDNAP